MKIKKIILFLLIVTLIIAIPEIVRAEDDDALEGNQQEIETRENSNDNDQEDDTNQLTWTDTSKAKVYIEKKLEAYRAEYTLKVEGITTINKHTYIYYITYNDEKPEIQFKSSNKVDLKNVNTEGTYPWTMKKRANEYLEKNGNIFFWLLEEQYNENTSKYEQKYIIEKLPLERPKLENLGYRITINFYDNETHSYVSDISTNTTGKKLNVKIGKVTDQNILLAIKNKEADSFNKLLTYSKSATPIYATTIPEGTSESITDKFEIKDKEYYYVYSEVDNQNGTLYPIENISLYQGKIDEKGKKYLFDFLDKKFAWNLGDGTPQQSEVKTNQTKNTTDTTIKTEKIPYAGMNMKMILLIISIIIVALIFYNKYFNYKDIK